MRIKVTRTQTEVTQQTVESFPMEWAVLQGGKPVAFFAVKSDAVICQDEIQKAWPTMPFPLYPIDKDGVLGVKYK